MILLIISIVLMVFGIFVFFKKNEGETEIDLFGAKLKSNNSAILLISLGAVFGIIWALKVGALENGSETGLNKEQQNAQVENSNGRLNNQSSSTTIADKYSKMGSCSQLSNLISALKTNYDEIKGASLGAGSDGAQRFRSNYTVADFPAYLETSPDGTDAFVQINIEKGANESYEGTQQVFYTYIELCLLEALKLSSSIVINGVTYRGRQYKVDDKTFIQILLQDSAQPATNTPPLIMRIYHFT